MELNIFADGTMAKYTQFESVCSPDLRLNITFSSEWNEYPARKIYARYLESPFQEASVDAEGSVSVPASVIGRPGINITIVGTSSGGRRMTTQEFFIPCEILNNPMF